MQLRAALLEPIEHEGWFGTILIGGLALFGWFLLIPLAFVHGYLIRVIRTGPEARLIEDIPGTLIDGVRAWLIALVYGLVPLVFGSLTVGASVVTILTGTESEILLGMTGFIIGGGVTVLLGIAFGYAAIGGITRFAHEGDFSAAFSLPELWRLLTTESFLIAYATSLALLFLVGVLTAIPVIGWVIGPFVFFYALVVSAILWSQGYQSAIRHSRDEGVDGEH